MNKKINELNKKFKTSEGSRIMLTNNELKDIIKVIKYLENRRILLKQTTDKVINQKGNFFSSSMEVGLPLTNSVLTPLAKNVLMP